MQITVEEIIGYIKPEDELEEKNLLKVLLTAAVSYCETELKKPILDSSMNATNKWDVPEVIRIAVYLLVSHWYENRAPVGAVTDEVAFSVNAILKPHKNYCI